MVGYVNHASGARATRREESIPMAIRTMSPALLIGGSGQVGARAATALRRLHPDLPIAIAGRDGRKAAAVAAEVGGPTTATTVDVGRDDLGLERGASFS